MYIVRQEHAIILLSALQTTLDIVEALLQIVVVSVAQPLVSAHILRHLTQARTQVSVLQNRVSTAVQPQHQPIPIRITTPILASHAVALQSTAASHAVVVRVVAASQAEAAVDSQVEAAASQAVVAAVEAVSLEAVIDNSEIPKP